MQCNGWLEGRFHYWRCVKLVTKWLRTVTNQEWLPSSQWPESFILPCNRWLRTKDRLRVKISVLTSHNLLRFENFICVEFRYWYDYLKLFLGQIQQGIDAVFKQVIFYNSQLYIRELTFESERKQVALQGRALGKWGRVFQEAMIRKHFVYL